MAFQMSRGTDWMESPAQDRPFPLKLLTLSERQIARLAARE